MPGPVRKLSTGKLIEHREGNGRVEYGIFVGWGVEGKIVFEFAFEFAFEFLFEKGRGNRRLGMSKE